MEPNKLVNALTIGVVLAVAGIGLFLLMYFVVFSGMEDATRLFASLLIPPMIMGVIIGVYYFMRQSKD